MTFYRDRRVLLDIVRGSLQVLAGAPEELVPDLGPAVLDSGHGHRHVIEKCVIVRALG